MDASELLLARYALGPTLGEGGFGAVHLGTDARTKKQVAIKLIAPMESMDAEDARTLIEREVKALTLLDHPGIVRLLDYGTIPDGRWCIVTELLVGCDLEHAVAAAGPMPAPAAIAMAHAMLAALGAAHAQAIQHRDVKPANVFLCTSGRVVLLDFGIARASENAASKTLARSANTGLMGTPYFFAPERVADLPVGPYTDVFAAGGTIYYGVTGELPFAPNAKSILEVMRAIAANARKPVATARPELPQALVEFIERCLAYKPPDRPQDGNEAAAELEPLFNATGGAAAGLKAYVARAMGAGQTQVARLAVRSRALTNAQRVDETAVVTLRAAPSPNTTAPRQRNRRAMLPSLAVLLVLAIAIALASARFWPRREQPSSLPPLSAVAPEAIPEPAPIEAPAVPKAVPAPQPAPKIATVKIVMEQWADITLDGATQGRKQHAARFTVTEGTHQIVFSHPGYPLRTAKVRVVAGEERVVHLDFDKSLP